MSGLSTTTKEKTAIRLLVLFAIIFTQPADIYADIPFGYNVQSGRVEVTGTSLDVPITAVSDMSHAFVLISPGTGYDNVDTNADVVQVRGYLQSTNNIRFERRSMSNSTWVSYQVIECRNNEFIVYRGQSSMTTAQTSKTLSIGATVTPANCLAFVTADNDTSSLFYYHEAMLTAHVSSATEVSIQRNGSGNAAPNFNWVVVEFDTNKIGSIQHGSVTADSAIYSSPQTVTISSVDLANSILIFQARTNQSGQVRTAWAGNFNLATEIKFYQHSPASSVDIVWYVIDFGDGSAQRGMLYESTSLWLISDATLTSVDTTKTMHFHSMTCGGTTMNYPRGMSTAQFTSPTNLRIQRMRNGQGSYIEWQVLELPNGVIDTTPPTPDQMTWATEPYATGTTSIAMEATTATDPSGVEYYFACTAGGGNNCDWQDDPFYEDMGLIEGRLYTYTVKARDKSPNQNETAPSTPASARTQTTNTLIVAESGGDYDNIQSAIDACIDGWTVGVDNGFWGGDDNRDLDFGGKRITVRSLDGPENCIINCGGTSATPHRAFYFHSGEDANSIVEGFTIKGGYAKFHMTIPGMDDPHGGAIYCAAAPSGEPSSPTIKGCIITDNKAVDDYGEAYGGAIFCLASAPTIVDCTISSNQANFGGGVWCGYPVDAEEPPVPTISNCTISDNVAICDDPVSYPTNGFGGGIYSIDTSIIIDNCVIIGNSALWGGGVCCEYSEDPEISYPQLVVTSSTISGNSAAYANPGPDDWGYATGGAIAMSPYCGGVISKCMIIGNYAVHYGGGIDCEDTSSLEIVNCIISGNLADSGNPEIASAGGAICCYGSSPTIVNCTISSNEAKDYGAQEYEDFGGGAVFCWVDPGYAYPINSQPDIKNCIFENNGGHAVHEYGDDGDPNLTYCLFHNNPDGDYYDWDDGPRGRTCTGADNINSIPDGFAWDNIDGDPLFYMNDPNEPEGPEDPNECTWTDDPNLAGNRTTLYDWRASFGADELVGKHINASISDPNQRRQAYITANTATTIEVVGDLTGYVAKGNRYQIIDYHLRHDSPCVDTGTSLGGPTTDIEGNPRPVDVPGVKTLTEGNPNNDGIIDFEDLLLLANNWLRDDCAGPGTCAGTDIAPPGGDGVVNYRDFSVVSFNWLVEALWDIGAYEVQVAQ